MNQAQRWAALAAAFILLIAALVGCTSAGDRVAGSLREKIAVDACTVDTGADGIAHLAATVSLPDYSAYMASCLEAAAADAKSEEDFEENLYRLVLEATEDAANDCTRELDIDLSALDADKAAEDWTQDALDEAARAAAFDAEVEEFCLSLLTETYPADFTPEDATAESEASAE